MQTRRLLPNRLLPCLQPPQDRSPPRSIPLLPIAASTPRHPLLVLPVISLPLLPPPRQFALSLFVHSAGRDGGFNGNDTPSGGGGGDNNDNDDDDDDDGSSGDENAENRNREEALMALAEVKGSLESLPKDLAAAIRAGRMPGAVVSRFLELEGSGLFRWLMQFGGFKERLLADDLFLAKVGMECGVGVFTKVVMAVIADFMLVYLPAPTVSLQPPLAISAGAIAKFFHGSPDNTFQVALAGSSFSFLQRIGAIVAGTAVTNALIGAQKAVNKSSASEVENLPMSSTSVAYGVYMAISSNLRYQVLAGVIEERILEPLPHQHKLMLSAICFAVRTGNTLLELSIASIILTYCFTQQVGGLCSLDGNPKGSRGAQGVDLASNRVYKNVGFASFN